MADPGTPLRVLHLLAPVGSAALLLELPACGGPRSTTVAARTDDDGAAVFSLDAAEVARIAALAGPAGLPA